MVNAKMSLRIHKANMIYATILKASKQSVEVDEKKLISTVCLEFGAGKRYIKEIIDDLLNVGKIKKSKNGGLITGKKVQ